MACQSREIKLREREKTISIKVILAYFVRRFDCWRSYQLRLTAYNNGPFVHRRPKLKMRTRSSCEILPSLKDFVWEIHVGSQNAKIKL